MITRIEKKPPGQTCDPEGAEPRFDVSGLSGFKINPYSRVFALTRFGRAPRSKRRQLQRVIYLKAVDNHGMHFPL
jgi:hypothetical protein